MYCLKKKDWIELKIKIERMFYISKISLDIFSPYYVDNAKTSWKRLPLSDLWLEGCVSGIKSRGLLYTGTA